MEEVSLPVESGTSYDSLKNLVQQAQQGDTSILPAHQDPPRPGTCIVE
jgi:hypothetical protein